MAMELETVVKIIEAVAIVLGGGIVLFKIGRAVEKFELIGKQQAQEIKELKIAVRDIGEVMTKVALQTQRQDTFAERLTLFERQLDDLRHGEGFIYPLTAHLPKPRP